MPALRALVFSPDCPYLFRVPLQLFTAAVAATCMLSSAAWSATFVVTNVNDAGPGSLRQAILGANANVAGATGEPDLIRFEIPAPAAQTVVLTTPLPPIVDSVVIDGYTQTDARPNISGPLANDAVLRIVLNGAQLTDRSAHGLEIRASNCSVRGLVIQGFGGDGIHIGARPETPSNNHVWGCFLGTDAAGFGAVPNRNGIRVGDGTRENLIGGPLPSHRNIISGNSAAGVVISGFNPLSNVLQNNYIGTDRYGTAELLNATGVEMNGAVLTVIMSNIIVSRDPNPALIELGASGGNSRIQGNRIGVDFFGRTILGHSGIYLLSGNNHIGGINPGEGNCIAGMATTSGAGSYITLSGATGGNVVQGNKIGVDVSGTMRRGDAHFGISIGNNDNNRIGGTITAARNVIGARTGIRIDGGEENLISGNFIGVSANGSERLSQPLPGDTGVLITLAVRNTIGGAAPGAGNVIGGFQRGVAISVAHRNVVRGNYIGTSATGDFPVPNGVGVEIRTRAPYVAGNFLNSVIGNLISGNEGDGIYLGADGGLDPEQTTIQGNYIGVAADGVSPLGNRGNGIRLAGSANVIGGTAAGATNVIAWNGVVEPRDSDEVLESRGILVVRSGERGNTISGNSIHSNLRLGIDLAGGGETAYVTPNDLGDVDAGANQLQNFPVLTSIFRAGENVRLIGSLNSKPNGSYRIEFFANEAVHPGGFGEGQYYLGFASVTTDASGNASFDVTLPTATAAHSFSATATDAQGNTSEFSAGQAQMRNISTRVRVQTGEDVLIAGFIVTGSADKKIIVRAIGPSLQAGAQPLPAPLDDPVLELLDAAGNVLGFNNDWPEEDVTSEVTMTGLRPEHERESAIVRTLAPGAYTAIVRGNGDTTGIGLVEVYDLDQRAGSRLANISSRGFVSAGDNVLIGGFIVGPELAEKTSLIIRALGPSLTAVGVSRALPDPVAELRDASGSLVAINDDWRENEAAVEASGLQPADEREPVLAASLAPGNYTVIVSGKADAEGVALVELYNVP